MWQPGKALGMALVTVLALLAPPTAAQDGSQPVADPPPVATCQPGIGCVTSLPLPRFVSLKGREGNARRGPGTNHRIDWVFTREGMPLMVTAEYKNWRRVEDQEGAGGWVHFALLSGVRTVLVTLDMAEIREAPADSARLVAQAEIGVIGWVLSCRDGWCRIAMEGQRGWMRKTALWGVGPDETVE